MGRRKRRKEAKTAAKEAGGTFKKKRHRLRKLMVLGSVAGGIAAWRQRQLAENETKFGSAR
ncbi:MAG: hypothetical protein H0W70_10720 [Actinobacteria bacterium]|nr:hypothetical protein [Actinomycetota bacterium]